MRDSRDVAAKAISAFEAETGIYIKEFFLFKDKMFSKIFVMDGEDGTKYALKIETTSRSIKREFELYKYLKIINVESLRPIFFNEELNALVTLMRDIEPVYKPLKGLKRGYRFDSLLVKIGEFCRLIEDRSSYKPMSNEKFQFEKLMIEKFDSCFFVKKALREKIKTWISKNAEDLDTASEKMSLSTDFNFYNLHIDNTGKLVLVDMGDAHFMPSYSNIAYLYLQFKFNRPKGSRLTSEDFIKVLDGYNCKTFYNSPSCLYFQIYHLIDMMDYYQLLVNRMPKQKALPAFIFYRVFRIQPMINEVKRLVRRA